MSMHFLWILQNICCFCVHSINYIKFFDFYRINILSPQQIPEEFPLQTKYGKFFLYKKRGCSHILSTTLCNSENRFIRCLASSTFPNPYSANTKDMPATAHAS